MTTTHPLIRFLLSSGDIEFSGAQIISAKLIEQTSITSSETPINTLEFKVRTTNNTFSMFSDSVSLIKEKLPLLAYEYVDGVARLLGKFYLDKWRNVADRVIEFTAYDIIGVLAETDFDGAFFSTPTTLPAVMSQTFAPINVSYEIAAGLESVEISGYIPAGNYRDALQQICFAVGAKIVTSRREAMSITYAFDTDITQWVQIQDSERMQKPTIELLPITSRIELVSHNYTQGTDIETIFDQYLEAGSYKIVYGKPYYSVVIATSEYTQTTLATEGSDDLVTENSDYIEAGGEYNAGSNSVNLTLTVAGQVIITGYPWIDSKQSFVYNETGTENVTNKKTLTISDATLVNVTNAPTILNLIKDYSNLRYLQKIRVLPTVDITTGNIVFSSTLRGRILMTVAQKIETNLTGGFLANIELRGSVIYSPPVINRYARAGVAISGMGLTHNNSFRQYE